MTSNSVGRATRRARRQRTLGPDARCTHCGWTEVTALSRSDDTTICYECQAVASGKQSSELHHHLGRKNDAATVALPGNLHRDLSDHQHDWPGDVLRNPERDPLLWLAAALNGLRDHVAWWVDWLEQIAAWLCSLSSVLQVEHGTNWSARLSLPVLWEAPSS